VIQIDGALLIALHENENGEDPRTGFRRRSDNGLKRHGAVAVLLGLFSGKSYPPQPQGNHQPAASSGYRNNDSIRGRMEEARIKGLSVDLCVPCG
jgi:hypothetical protein